MNIASAYVAANRLDEAKETLNDVLVEEPSNQE